MKLAKHLIEKGLNPRLLNCILINKSLIVQKIEELLPYCKVILRKEFEDCLFVDIDFYDFIYTIKLSLMQGETGKVINKITIER